MAVHTIQALSRNQSAAQAALATTDCLWLDEAHHYVGSSWECVWDLVPASCAVLGVTATPARADGIGLGGRFGALVSTASYGQLLAGGWLVQCDVRVSVGADPAAAYLAHGRGRPGVLFAPTMATCAAACGRLVAAGVRAAVIDSTTTDKARRSTVAAYDRGDLDVLCSPTALAEGFDSPRAEVCVLGRTCRSEALYLQIVGRVLRPHPGKARALLLDCTGASEQHGPPTADRQYSLTGRGIRRAQTVSRRPAALRKPRLNLSGNGPMWPSAPEAAAVPNPPSTAARLWRGLLSFLA